MKTPVFAKLLVLFLWGLIVYLPGCRQYDVLLPIPDYHPASQNFDTSAMIAPQKFLDGIEHEVLTTCLQKNNYRIIYGAHNQTGNARATYVLTVLDTSSQVLQCEDGNYLESKIIVMVRPPALMLEEQWHCSNVRYFPAYSQLYIENRIIPLPQDLTAGIRLAMENLFTVEEFRRALEPRKTPAWMQQIPASGDGQALWQFSLYYQSGENEDLHDALRWALLAQKSGQEDARKFLITKGLFGSLFYEKLMWDTLVTDDLWSRNRLGMLYETGSGVPQDLEKAFQLYIDAAWEGYADAQYNAGRCYKNGFGVEANRAMAFHWLQKAAAQNSEAALILLAEMKKER